MLSRPIAAGSDRGAGSRYFPRSLCAVASWCSASTLPGARASSRARIDGRHPRRPASAAVPLSRPQPRTAGTTVRATGDPRWRSECQSLIAGGSHRCPESRIGERRRWTGVLPVGPRPAARASKMAACHWAHPVGDENHDAARGIGRPGPRSMRYPRPGVNRGDQDPVGRQDRRDLGGRSGGHGSGSRGPAAGAAVPLRCRSSPVPRRSVRRPGSGR